MDCGEKKVEAKAPIGQPGEIAERLADPNAIIVGAIPNPNDDDRGEDVEGNECAQTCQNCGRQQP